MVAYRRKPVYRRRRKLTANRVIRGSSSARTQKAQIATLARKTNRLSKAISQDRIYGQFVTNVANRTMSSPYLITDITPNLSQRTAVFNDQTAVTNAKGFKFTKLNMDYLVQPYNESSVIDMTMFLVSLQPEVAKKVHIETTLMTVLTAAEDYVATSVPSFAMMNKGRFKVHYVKRLQTFENYTDNTPQTRGFHRGYIKRSLNDKIINETGNWTLVDDTEHPLTARYFLIVFNNNSAVDLEHPTITYNALWSGHTCAY